MSEASEARMVVFGEILYDIFAEGDEVLGGSAFNLAWNLAGMGLNPLLISRIGRDNRGRAILEAMEGFGLDTSGVQQDDTLHTGIMEISSKGGKEKTHIPRSQAFDAIDMDEALKTVENVNASLLYHGTLPIRSKKSRTALDEIKKYLNKPVYVDVNMQPSSLRSESVMEFIEGSHWVQANMDELEMLVGAISFVGLDQSKMINYLLDITKVKGLIVTMGKEGALYAIGDTSETIEQASFPSFVDTHGCGDAFASAMVAGLHSNWPLKFAVERANDFAAKVCQLKGAISVDKKFYTEATQGWGLG